MAVEDMTTEGQISKNQDERDEARQNLRDTLAEVKAKVERAGSDLPNHIFQSHPIATCLVAGALGFLLGTKVKGRGTGPIMIAALLGFALSMRSSREGSGRDGRERSFTD